MVVMVVVICILAVLLTFMLAVVAYQMKLIHQLQELVATDPLTGLLNRRAFIRALGRMMDLLSVENEHRQHSLDSLSVFFIDLDHFKQINDRYGHAIGDEVLKAVAAAVRMTLRESDLVCRWGGEEIVVALPNLRINEAAKVAEKLRQTIARLTFCTEELKVTTSIGITATQKFVPYEKLIASADKAVYEAKSCGRDQVVIN